MTPREIVKAAIAHQNAPRVPYCIQLTGDARAAVEPQLGMPLEEFLDNDVERVWPVWWDWHNLGEDWTGAAVPASRSTVRGTGSYEQLADAIKASKDAADKYVLAMVYCSHFEKANYARGIENFMADMACEPEFARGLLNRIIEKNMVMLENFLHMPEIDGVLLGSDWGTQRGLLMSPAMWDDLIRPGEQREYDLVRSFGKDVWIHSCGKIDPLIGRLIEMGVSVLNPVQPECMDLEKLKADFGDKLAFWGGISTQQTLPFGTPKDVRQESRRVKKLLSRGGGYILSASQEIQTDVPLANLRALLEVAREIE